MRVADEITNTKIYKPSYAPVSKNLKSAPGVEETLIRGTIYDTQTNASVDNRCYVYPNGDIAAVWTMGFTPTAYPDRGTGYNFYDGSWGPEPTARLEATRTGWPTYTPLNDGEAIAAHEVGIGLRILTRPVRGTYAWTTHTLPGPAGSTSMTWPRMISNKPNTLHLIVCSNVAYQGLDLALLYTKSENGGATWTIPVVLPQLTAAAMGAGAGKSFNGFSGDNYSWAAPKGDTIAFAVADNMAGVIIMKSFDNGDTWNKTTVLTIPVLSSSSFSNFCFSRWLCFYGFR